jgi:hypothetical protein
MSILRLELLLYDDVHNNRKLGRRPKGVKIPREPLLSPLKGRRFFLPAFCKLWIWITV